ncbi:hypothetical protein SSX86_032218 [Deinandra increscens subsp. villosa]|uniref:BED-type domain-containing protein n=1 Tax=Deinandra increscens subsp. villosa TaxID=3103831 RepID=A0AAP0C7Q3_9ASTR
MSMESTAKQKVSPGLKRNSDDIGWEFGVLVDPSNPDKTKCNRCGKIQSGGVYRLKQHIAGVGGQCKPCLSSTNEDKLKARNALNDVKRKKKDKEEGYANMRAEVNIGKETIDLDDEFGDLKGPKSFGPMHRFSNTSSNDPKGRSKQSNLSNIVLKEQLNRVKEYICDWAYQCGIPFHCFEKDSFRKAIEAIGQFGPNVVPPTRYEMAETFVKKTSGEE